MNLLVSILIVLVIFIAQILISFTRDNIYNGVIESYMEYDNRTIIRMSLGGIDVITVPGIMGKRGDIVKVDIHERRIVY